MFILYHVKCMTKITIFQIIKKFFLKMMSESEEVGVGVGESPQAPSKVETGRNVLSL